MVITGTSSPRNGTSVLAAIKANVTAMTVEMEVTDAARIREFPQLLNVAESVYAFWYPTNVQSPGRPGPLDLKLPMTSIASGYTVRNNTIASNTVPAIRTFIDPSGRRRVWTRPTGASAAIALLL